jgi:hypothetical protein
MTTTPLNRSTAINFHTWMDSILTDLMLIGNASYRLNDDSRHRIEAQIISIKSSIKEIRNAIKEETDIL